MQGKTHSLPGFSAYLNKGFRLRDLVARLTDARHDPDISPQSIFLALFYSFAFRLPSFQQLEADLQHSFLPHWTRAHRPFFPPPPFFLASFYSFAFRLPSFQQLEADLQHSFLPQWIGAERPFRD